MMLRQTIGVLCLALFFCLSILWMSDEVSASEEASQHGSALYINEFMADNETVLEDPDDPGDFPDWIEIYNSGDVSVDLNGMYLTDDLTDLTQYPITSTVMIDAQGFVIFYADGESGQGVLHTNFGLRANGEEVALVDSDGVTIIDSYAFGEQTADISEGRFPDGTNDWRFFEIPSPGSANLSPPVISEISHQPTYPTSSESVSVSAIITDNAAVISATLYYSVTGMMTAVMMADQGNAHYTATIPAFPDDTFVQYYIMAEDDQGDVSVDPPDAPNTWYGYTVGYTPPALYINEFMASNDSTLEDPDDPGDYPDWIELYNASDDAIDLEGHYLTDDPMDLTQYPITDSLMIEAEGFLLFYADDESGQGIQHTNFGLSANGDALLLVAPDGVTIIDSYTFGAQTTDVSEGRFPDGTDNWRFLEIPSPGSANLSPPVIAQTSHQPTYPSSSDTVSVSAMITDNTAVMSATLYYSATGELVATPMIMGADNYYTATIPAFPDDTQVNYYIEAEDNQDGVSTDPADAPMTMYHYLVGYTPPQLYINEFMADNETTLIDPDEPCEDPTVECEYPDWIEIYNAEDEAVNLEGFYLTDDLTDMSQYGISLSVVVPPHSFVLFYADNDPEQGVYHTNFRLSSSGESLALVAPNGFTIVDSYTFGAQTADVSEGRRPDGSDTWMILDEPSPNRSNNMGLYKVYLPIVLK